jgi:hypothetical protein
MPWKKEKQAEYYKKHWEYRQQMKKVFEDAPTSVNKEAKP